MHSSERNGRKAPRLCSGFVLSALLCLFSSVAAMAAGVSLTLLHTNDTHGHLLPFSYPNLTSPGSATADMPERNNIGGIARRSTLVKEIRGQLQAKGISVLLVDAGDFCDGTPFSTEYHGEADVAAMNACAYDFATLGNHEFNNPLEQVKKLIAQADYPILCANATLTSTGEPLVPAHKVIQVGPVRVGLFGLVTHEASTYPAAKDGVTIEDEIGAARKITQELRSRADIIVLISHCGQEVDEKLAAQVPEIDVIVGGHSHSRLPTGEFIWHSEDLMEDAVNGTVIVQAHQWGGELGRCDLLLEQDPQGGWHVDRYRERLIPVDSSLAEDPAVAKVVEQYWSPIAGRFNEVVGTAADDFTSRGDDRAEYNLVADAVRETFAADFDLENLGGVRSPLVKGNITTGDLVNLDPFNNTVVLYKITGAQLRGILQKHTPAVSGLRYRVENRTLVDVTVGGQPLDDARVYSGAANSYFAGYALKGIELTDTKKPRLDVLREFIRKQGTVRPAYDGRRVVMGG